MAAQSRENVRVASSKSLCSAYDGIDSMQLKMLAHCWYTHTVRTFTTGTDSPPSTALERALPGDPFSSPDDGLSPSQMTINLLTVEKRLHDVNRIKYMVILQFLGKATLLDWINRKVCRSRGVGDTRGMFFSTVPTWFYQ